MPLRFSRGGCKGQNPAPHNAIVENTPGFPHRVEKTVDFSPPFSQPVENYVEKHGMHSRMQPLQTANPGIAAEKYAPRCPVDMHKKPDGQIPQANRKPHRMSTNAGGQNPRLSHRKQKKSVHNDRFVAVGTPPDTKKSPQNPPPDADFHNPSRQNPDIPHRTAPAKTPKSSCRGWIFRFSTVPRPLLLLLLDGRIEGWTDRARARGRRKAGRR